MERIAVRSIDGDGMAQVLQTDSSIHNKTLCPSNAEIRVDEEDGGLWRLLFGRVSHSWVGGGRMEDGGEAVRAKVLDDTVLC